MTNQIRILPEKTINQIAAGEVVENPASVVKELVENACDAGATDILIEIEGGGLQRIAISDNGSGMTPDDAVLSLERYATSKIRHFEDVWTLQTMGFRGEALASIASISKLTLMTAKEGGVGTKISVDGGKILKVEPCARRQGTTIDVRALFFNVPARKKFQKSETGCAQEVSRLVTAMSLAYPDVGFTLMSQGERVLFAPAHQTIGERVASVLGDPYVHSSSPFEIDTPFLMRGMIGSPGSSRPQRSGQYLFINKRFVTSPLVSYAVKDGYGTRLQEGRHPIYVLHLDIPPELVDINVHPQKREVRFRDEKQIKEEIQRAVQKAFMREEGIAPPSPSFAFSFRETAVFTDPLPSFALPIQEVQTSLFQEPLIPIGLYETTLFLEGKNVAKRIPFGGEGIVLVDLLAASGRVVSDTFSKAGRLEKQELLIPVTFELSLDDARRLRTQEIEHLGFAIRPLGDTGFIVEALPAFMEPDEVKDALLSMLSEEKEPARILSCFAAARKKQFVLQEALALFEKLILSSSPYECPRGKPTMVHLNGSEISKLFKKAALPLPRLP